MSLKRFCVILAVMTGALAGLGTYTFAYAQGFSYFSHAPESCNNCHVMNEFYDGWRKSSHHAAAVCVDCHMPEGLMEKVIAKADNGWRHSTRFTFMNFHDPIRITERNSEILQANCIRCHADFLHNLTDRAETKRDEVRCVRCHSHVGHGIEK